MRKLNMIAYSAIFLLIAGMAISCPAQQIDQESIDKKVKAFLEKHSGQWYDMNVPANDGKLLYNLILDNNYTQALEIGTSTGHSGIWMAWALSKTGGRLITIGIDEKRHNEALKNFKEAGVDHLIEAHLANAHDMVPSLKGPFDFVFSDADKSWYQNYFEAVDPKLKINGCYATHNVSDRQGSRWNRDYLNFLLGLDHYKTTVNNNGGGMAVSFKNSEK